MIVDDEVIIRTGLSKVIKWEELGIELLLPAASAEEAIVRIEEEKPDILLTDIRMTGKTGLQLTEEAKQLNPNLEVIILSGYDDFLYAQQAIRHNVSDYLLKTSKPEEIVKTVLRVMKRIEDRFRADRQDYLRIREEQTHLLEWLVVDGRVDARSSELVGHMPPYRVVIARAEGWGNDAAEQSLLAFAVDNMAAELLTSASFIRKHEVVMVISENGPAGDRSRQLERITKMERLLKSKLTLAAGREVQRTEDLHLSYRDAVVTLEYQPFMKKSYWMYEEITGRRGGRMICTLEEENQLSAVLVEDDPIALKQWVEQIIGQLADDPEATPQSLEVAIRSILIAAHRWLNRMHAVQGRQPVHDTQRALWMDVNTRNPVDSVFQQLYTIMKSHHNHASNGRSAHVQRAIAYIEESPGHELSLQQVAEHVHLHPNHLSDIFKKETGIKFIDYVAASKMRKAAERLAATNAKISEIAGSVGYEDAKYFGQIFRKHTGKTPSEYREAAWADKRR